MNTQVLYECVYKLTPVYRQIHTYSLQVILMILISYNVLDSRALV